jgi:hypothetical protein
VPSDAVVAHLQDQREQRERGWYAHEKHQKRRPAGRVGTRESGAKVARTRIAFVAGGGLAVRARRGIGLERLSASESSLRDVGTARTTDAHGLPTREAAFPRGRTRAVDLPAIHPTPARVSRETNASCPRPRRLPRKRNRPRPFSRRRKSSRRAAPSFVGQKLTSEGRRTPQSQSARRPIHAHVEG